jgi:hypothetical protein
MKSFPRFAQPARNLESTLHTERKGDNALILKRELFPAHESVRKQMQSFAELRSQLYGSLTLARPHRLAVFRSRNKILTALPAA